MVQSASAIYAWPECDESGCNGRRGWLLAMVVWFDLRIEAGVELMVSKSVRSGAQHACREAHGK